MPKRLTPKPLTVKGCSAKCSLNKDNLSESEFKTIHGWYEAGWNDFKMEEAGRDLGLTLSHGAIGRHRKNHLVEESETLDDDLSGLSDLEAIDLALSRGQANIKNWKLTPSEYIKFMELKYRLTQGSTNDALFATLAEVGSGANAEDNGPSEDLEEAEPELG